MVITRALLFPTLWLLFLSAPYAAEYHVSTTGNDGNTGTTDQPFGTIQKCATVAQAGDTCLVETGNYPERVTPTGEGTPDRLITFKAQGGVVMKGFTLTSGHIRVEGFEITDTANTWPKHNKCSTVETCTFPFAKLVESVVSPTFCARAGISLENAFLRKF